MDKGDVIPNEEYEAQFFGFSPFLVTGDIGEIILQEVDIKLNKLEELLLECNPNPLSQEELKTGMSLLRSTTEKSINRTVNQLKVQLLERIFKLPEYLLLEENAENAKKFTPEEIEEIKQKIQDNITKIANEKYMQHKLEEELKELDKVLEVQKRILENPLSTENMKQVEIASETIGFLQDKCDSLEKLTEDFALLSQLPSEKNVPYCDDYILSHYFK